MQQSSVARFMPKVGANRLSVKFKLEKLINLDNYRSLDILEKYV